MGERVTLKALRRKLIAWQESNPGSDRVPLEIQQAAKEIGKRHGYMALSRYLKIDVSRLFADVGMGKRAYKSREKASGTVSRGHRKKPDSPLNRNITITALPSAPTTKQQISVSVYFKNGLRCELETSANEFSILLSHLAGVAC